MIDPSVAVPEPQRLVVRRAEPVPEERPKPPEPAPEPGPKAGKPVDAPALPTATLPHALAPQPEPPSLEALIRHLAAQEKPDRGRLAMLRLAAGQFVEAEREWKAQGDDAPADDLARLARHYTRWKLGDEVEAGLDGMKAVVKAMERREPGLTLDRLTLCRDQAKAFRNFKAIPAGYVYLPGDWIYLYAEVSGFQARETEQSYEVSLRCDFELLDEKGESRPEVREIWKSYEREFKPSLHGPTETVCIRLGLQLPRNTPFGEHGLRLKVLDAVGNGEGEAEIRLRVGAR